MLSVVSPKKPLHAALTVADMKPVLLCNCRLVVQLRQDCEDWQKTVKEFALHLCMTPTPLCGNLQLVSRCGIWHINCFSCLLLLGGS